MPDEFRSESLENLREIDLTELAKHNSETSLWIAFDEKVCDLTKYLASHPGGDALLRYAGKEATKAILEQPAHKSVPNFIKRILNQNQIGVLKP